MTFPLNRAPFHPVAARLASTSTEVLQRWVNEAVPLGTGIGGATGRIVVDGEPVFVKQLRLTDAERQAGHWRHTRDLHGLPAHLHRNVGSVGVGAWRELAAHLLTTEWLLSGQAQSFPRLYHWRVLEGAPASAPGSWNDTDRMLADWGQAPGLRARLEALAGASARLVLFMEHLPMNLQDWLACRRTAGPQALAAACRLVERALAVDVAAMNAGGLLHGDMHLRNLLTDGQRICFADFGLALSDRFELSPDERAYLQEHASLDQAYARAKWVGWLVAAFGPADAGVAERMATVQAIADGQAVRQALPGVPDDAAAIIRRDAPVTALINAFYVRLHEGERDAPYPHRAVAAALGRASAGDVGA